MTRRVRTFLTLVACGVLGVGAAYLVFITFEPDRTEFPVVGIDVSHHNGAIDWAAVAKDDVGFVYIKATEGGDFKDKRFAQNWANARKVGLLTGAYHFFTLCRPGAEQAKNFIASVPVQKDSLPPVVDLEFGGNCNARPSKVQLRKDLRAFLSQVELTYKKKPVLYVTREFFEDYIDSDLSNYPLWVRSIMFAPEFGHNAWKLWQFHNRGRRDGIVGPVDLNVFRGTAADLAAFSGTPGVVARPPDR